MKTKLVIIFFIAAPAWLWSNSVNPVSYLKKLNKVRVQIDDIFTAMPESGKLKGKAYDVMNLSIKDSETAISSGLRKEGVKYMLIAGEAQKALLFNSTEFLINHASTLVFILSTNIQKDEPRDKKNLFLFGKARDQLYQAKKFYRDKNYTYSLHLLKSSVKYSITCFQNSDYPLPQEYALAKKLWLDGGKKESAPPINADVSSHPDPIGKPAANEMEGLFLGGK